MKIMWNFTAARPKLPLMFTGLIQDIGQVTRVEARGDTRFTIATQLDLSREAIGASIACAGCCLTVIEKTADSFTVEVSAETLSKTHLGLWQQGTKLNLEPSLRLGDEIGGHIVSGHVDGLAELMSVQASGGSHVLLFRVPEPLKKYLAQKGSVTLDGVSLTVNTVEDARFSVNIIPHTWAHTTLGLLNAGDRVHIEIDMLARYVARMMECK